MGCTDENYIEYNSSSSIDNGTCSTYINYGCLDNYACNYNPFANYNDSTCVYAFENSLNCNNSSIQIGDIYQGGIIFYIDETGEHGKIASINNYGEIFEYNSGDAPQSNYFSAAEFCDELIIDV